MLRQKLYAIIILAFTIWMMTKGIGTLAIITIPTAIFMFFSKVDYTRHDY